MTLWCDTVGAVDDTNGPSAVRRASLTKFAGGMIARFASVASLKLSSTCSLLTAGRSSVPAPPHTFTSRPSLFLRTCETSATSPPADALGGARGSSAFSAGACGGSVGPFAAGVLHIRHQRAAAPPARGSSCRSSSVIRRDGSLGSLGAENRWCRKAAPRRRKKSIVCDTVRVRVSAYS